MSAVGASQVAAPVGSRNTVSRDILPHQRPPRVSDFVRPRRAQRVFEASLELARSRGYLDRPEFAEWRGQVPAWLTDLWAEGGVQRFEQRLGVVLPTAVRAFYGIPELVVCVHALDPYERDFFFAETGEEPAVCRWDGVPYLAVAMHGHSGGVYGVQLGGRADPPMATGFADEAEAIGPLAKTFGGFIRRAIRRGPAEE